MGSLHGRIALVTGGGRGIGRAIALALAREGCDVAVAARTAAQVEEAALEVAAAGRRSLALAADVTLPDSVAAMARRAQDELGGVDILVNCAGGAESAPFLRTGPDLWDRTIALNLTSVYLVTHAVIPGMVARGWGRVINVASRAGIEGHAYVTAYCAAKHGVVGLTRALALEVGDRGVTVNAICPGYVDTDMTRRSAESIAAKTGRPVEQALDCLAGFNPSGRLITAEEVASAALRMAAADGSSFNGQVVPI